MIMISPGMQITAIPRQTKGYSELRRCKMQSIEATAETRREEKRRDESGAARRLIQS